MSKLIILGSGAATGVPSISSGWGNCNPNNPKNIRQRAGIYFSSNTTEILFDTSPDIKNQLIKNNIFRLDGVLYTHTHADHLHGIDDLRGITRNLKSILNIYAIKTHLDEIIQRFDYVFVNLKHKEITNHPELYPNEIVHYQEFYIGDIKIMPLEFSGHTTITTGYCINDGELVIIPDFKYIPDKTMKYLQNINVNVLIMPLTMLQESVYHAGIKTVLSYAKIINAKKTILTHMATECDYDEINNLTPENIMPAYDNMTINMEAD